MEAREATERYRKKYAQKQTGNFYKWSPAGRKDVYLLCDTIESMADLIESYILGQYKAGDCQRIRDRLVLILQRLQDSL